MLNRAVLIVIFGMIYVDMNTAVEYVPIEQTHGYMDTWTNVSLTCSLLGAGRLGNVWTHAVNLGTHDITGTGWISAHVEHNGMLKFLGCVTGYVPVGTSGLEVSHNRIPECIYFCKSDDFYLHQNVCYCNINVIAIKPGCSASQCGNEELLFCGKSAGQSGKCMCHYQFNSSNISNKLIAGSGQHDEVTNCKLHQRRNNQWHVTCQKMHGKCNFFWNGYVLRESFFWGTSSSVISNHQGCVAIRRVNTSEILTLVTLPCSSKQTGICIKGTRISKTPQATPSVPSTVILPTSPRYEIPSTDLTSHKIPQLTSPIYDFHRSTNDVDIDTLLASTTTLNSMDSTAIKDGLTSVKPLQSSSEPIKRDQTTHIHWSLLDEVTTLQSTSDAKKDDRTTNILEPVLGGVGTFVVLVIVGVIVIVVRLKRRNKSNNRSQPPRELNILSLRKQKQNQNINYATKHWEGHKQIHAVDTGDNDSLQNRMRESENVVYDLCDHTLEAGDNVYGRLNQDSRGNVSLETADIYDHSRTVVQVNGDTYDSFETGVSREDRSADYYDHTHVGEDYGYLQKGGNRNGQIDDIYDHTRGNGQSNEGTYDSFKTGRGREDASETCYDHTGVSAGYGYLQKGSKVTVLSDNNDYDTMNVVKGNK